MLVSITQWRSQEFATGVRKVVLFLPSLSLPSPFSPPLLSHRSPPLPSPHLPSLPLEVGALKSS